MLIKMNTSTKRNIKMQKEDRQKEHNLYLKMLGYIQITLIKKILMRLSYSESGRTQKHLIKNESLYFQAVKCLSWKLMLNTNMKTHQLSKKSKNQVLKSLIKRITMTYLKSQWKLKRKIRVENQCFGRKIKCEVSGNSSHLALKNKLQL